MTARDDALVEEYADELVAYYGMAAIPPREILRDLIAEARTVPCPECEELSRIGPRTTVGSAPCGPCGGTGRVSREYAGWMEAADWYRGLAEDIPTTERKHNLFRSVAIQLPAARREAERRKG